MSQRLTRRQALTTVVGGASASTILGAASGASAAGSPARWKICLNTSTVLAEGDDAVVKKIDAAAKAGYDAVEPWVPDLARYQKSGGSLADLGKRIADAGLAVPSAVAFYNWLFTTGADWDKGLEDAKRNMELVRAIGGTGMLASPSGRGERLDMLDAGRRYRALLEAGRTIGVTPYMELWGFVKIGHTLGECVGIALEAQHPDARIVPDIYHLYKGGSGFASIRHLRGEFVHIFHFNDVPADHPRETIRDADRVWPGDGVAPLTQVLKDLRHIGYTGMLSLELFNREYWKLEPTVAARQGLDKMRQVIAESGT